MGLAYLSSFNALGIDYHTFKHWPVFSVNIDDYHCVTIAEFERFGQGAEARSGAAEAKPPKRGLTRILRNPCTNPGFQAASRSKSGDRADVT